MLLHRVYSPKRTALALTVLSIVLLLTPTRIGAKRLPTAHSYPPALAQQLGVKQTSRLPTTILTIAAAPLDAALDSSGNTISIPHQARVALEYTPPTNSVSSSIPSLSSTKPATRSIKKTGNTALANLTQFANHPSCRWLFQRISHLTSQAQGKTSHRAQFIRHELTSRQNEWKCLKCNAQGPSLGDDKKCQFLD